MGAAALQSIMAQQISNNRLLPESDHGAALGAPLVSVDARAVWVVFPMIIAVMNFCGSGPDASRVNGVIPGGQTVESESVSWKCVPLHCVAAM